MKTPGLEYKNSGFAMATGPGVGANGGAIIQGFLTIFGEIDLGGDRTVPGSFRAAEGKTFPLLWAHNPDALPLGKVIRLAEIPEGVYFQAAISGTSMGQDAKILIKDRALSGVSYGYNSQSSYSTVSGKRVRNLDKVDLVEVSLVNFPMLPSARLGSLGGDLSDALIIAETETDGIPIANLPKAKAIRYLEACERQSERVLYSGKTRRELLYDAYFGLQELQKMAV